ncbi:MAG TPA: PAS domain S-box protein [Deltaproteobacteria bacterium]|nr:PAS domain S-box protein [Deltaproteobacteria bacterium]
MNHDTQPGRFSILKGLDQYSDLEGWRNYYVTLMLLVALVVMPLGFVSTFPYLISERKFGLISFDMAAFLVLFYTYFWVKNSSARSILFFLSIYAMTATYLIALGPYYARPGWLVLCTVISALLFGTQAAMLTTAVNAAVLLAFFWVFGQHLQSWAIVHAEPVSKWTMFVVNLSIVSLAASLPVSLLLDRLNTSFLHERDLLWKLSAEREVLQETTVSLQREMDERKQVEKALRESENYLDKIINAVADPIFVKDRQHRWVLLNDAACIFFGHSREELLGRSDYEFFPREEADVFWEKDELVFTSGVENVNEEKITDAGGNVHTIVTKKTLYRDAGGEQFIVAVIRDVTESKLAELDKKRLEDQLAQAQKMESLGTLAGGIAHDFNNILSAIIGYSELALGDASEPDTARSEIKEAIKAADRAKDLVKQILTFSRRAETTYSPLDLPPLVKGSLKMLRSVIPTTIEIRQDLVPSCLVMSDPTQVNQLIMNLCTNAAHAMDETGGVLTVRLRKEAIDGVMAHELDIKPGSYVRLTVGDTGHGMAPEVVERIFEPYFTTKELGRGTGLGLSVVHGIVKSQNGAVTCTSTPGTGTAFDVYLPEITLGVDTTELAQREPLPTGNARILFVDDEPTLANLAEKMLGRLGYAVVTRTSSIDALAHFQNNPADFDLVISDMTMPGLTGDKLALKLLEIRPDIPIILCTGYSEHISEEKAKEIGIREFALKPLEMRELAKIIQRVFSS